MDRRWMDNEWVDDLSVDGWVDDRWTNIRTGGQTDVWIDLWVERWALSCGGESTGFRASQKDSPPVSSPAGWRKSREQEPSSHCPMKQCYVAECPLSHWHWSTQTC